MLGYCYAIDCTLIRHTYRKRIAELLLGYSKESDQAY